MKNLTLITILILTFITGDTYSQSYFGKSLFKDRIQANNVRYVTSLAQGTNEYATITAALSAYQTGDLIILAPEYFDEDVTISIDNVHIQGLSKELSKIKSLTVTGGYARLESFTVNGTSTFTSQKTYQGYWNGLDNNTEITDVIFKGTTSIGTQALSIKENIKLYNPTFIGDIDIIINTVSTSVVFTVGWSSFPIEAGDGKRPDLILYGGALINTDGKETWLDTIYYKSTGVYTQLDFSRFGKPFFIMDVQTVTSTQFHVLVLSYCVMDLGNNTAGSLTFRGLFELDIHFSSVALWKNIVFNSTANSRIMSLQQRGWQSTSQISGTGLNKLRIYNSSLSGTAPVGLADDRGNVWSAFMDN